jgi:carbon monoxide dehydrogenase subunit G
MAPMDLTHRFRLPAGVGEAWNAFNNVEQLAPCFPGATITNVEGDEFTGKLKIKLGPSTLVYDGSGRYLERNEAERQMVIEAHANEERRNGTAKVTVSASFTGSGEQTDVEVRTALVINGKPAHFGDEVIADVSEKLLDQFVSCISGQFASGLGATYEEFVSGTVTTEAAARFDEADNEKTIELEPVPAVAEEAAVSTVGGIPPSASEAGPAAAAGLADISPPVSEPPRVGAAPQGDTAEGALNVIGAVVPVLLKRFGPALAILGLLLFVVIKIMRRRS